MSDDEYDRVAFAVVKAPEAKAPYPVVRVKDDGSVYELDAEDRAWMEEAFHPCDGARPYVKDNYRSKNGWGKIGGFCFRKHIPSNVRISSEPAVREPEKKGVELLRELAEAKGLALVEKAKGSYVMVRTARTRRKWWQFWKAV